MTGSDFAAVIVVGIIGAVLTWWSVEVMCDRDVMQLIVDSVDLSVWVKR